MTNYPTLSRLVESANTAKCSPAQSYDDIISYLRDRAQPWIQQAKQVIAYRGMNGAPQCGYGWVSKPRTDRLARDTPPMMHHMINDLYTERGLSTRRENSLYVSNRPNQASYYTQQDVSKVYAVVPLGEFEFTWFGLVGDVYTIYIHPNMIGSGTLPESMFPHIRNWAHWKEGYPPLSDKDEAAGQWVKDNMDLRVGEIKLWETMHSLGNFGWEGSIHCSEYFAMPYTLYLRYIVDDL